MRRIEKVLLVLGILSLVVLALPDLGMLAAMTIIGLPLAIAYWAIPAIFLVTLVAYLIHRVLPLSGKLAVTASVVLAVAALALPPFVLNSAIHRQAASFAAGDLNKLSLPLTAHSIASREKFRFRKGATKCDGFCLHSLLTGTAKRFLVAHSDTPYGEVSPDQDAIAFQLERRQDCPPVSFKSGAHTLSFRRVNASTVRAADPVETLKLRISNGECLVSAPAKLGDADLVVSRGKVSTGVSRYAGTGFSLNLDTIAASRISVHEKKDGTSFGETFRQTQVQYRPFGWFMLPAPD
ncbi:MAG: hypothetical protein HKN05_22560, partial [Rhizobiales bacterium]|nr:hypothetical protein [Hyphomicrobiales bacterium]